MSLGDRLCSSKLLGQWEVGRFSQRVKTALPCLGFLKKVTYSEPGGLDVKVTIVLRTELYM